MKVSSKLIIGGLLLILLYGIFREITSPNYVKTETITETVIDTTKVDSLQTIIDSYQNLPSQRIDTVYADTLYITEQASINDSTRTYRTTYRDSTITINISSAIGLRYQTGGYQGVLVNQDLNYFLRQERVRTIDNEIVLTRTKVITNTERYVEKPKPYFSGGAIGGNNSFGPVVSYTSPSKTTVFYHYDLVTDSHKGGFLLPLNFNIRDLF